MKWFAGYNLINKQQFSILVFNSLSKISTEKVRFYVQKIFRTGTVRYFVCATDYFLQGTQLRCIIFVKVSNISHTSTKTTVLLLFLYYLTV